MSGLRCWPGCLAYIVRSDASNHGKLVHVIRAATPEEQSRWYHADEGFHWRVRAAGAPIVLTLGVERMETTLPDGRLRPILPPPATDTTPADEAAPCDVHPAWG